MRRSRRSGVVFIMTLFIMVAILAIVVAVAANQNTANLARFNRIDRAKARLIAESGIQRAVGMLSEQPLTMTRQSDAWATIGSSQYSQPGTIRFTVGDGTYRVQILDTGSLIDLNTATQQQLQMLPLTTQQVDAILDWRETNLNPRADGAKDAYYNNLQSPYNTKLGPFDSIDELLLVRYMTPAALYDVPQITGTSVTAVAGTNNQQPTLYSMLTVDSLTSNTSPTGTAKLNVNQRGIQARQLQQRGIPFNLATTIASRAPIANLGSLLTLPGVNSQNAITLLNNLTTSTATQVEGKINLNTASQSVLNAVPGVQTNISQAIINQQATGFNGIGDLLSVPGVSVQSAAQFIDSFTVSSQTFLVRVVGSYGSANVALEAVVKLGSGTGSGVGTGTGAGTAQIMKIYEPPFSDMPTRWGWYDVQTDQTIVDMNQQAGTQ